VQVTEAHFKSLCFLHFFKKNQTMSDKTEQNLDLTEEPQSENKFTWVPFHKELARTLLNYRNKQEELINIIRRSKEALQDQFGIVGLSLTDKDEDGEIKLKVMEPFSFFATIHRRMRLEPRIRVAEIFKEELSLDAAVPDNFDGIPIRNPQNNWYFLYEKDRSDDDISNFWDLAEFTVQGGDFLNASKTFQKVLSIDNVGVSSITQGMFWLNPEKYLPLDSHTMEYFKYHGIKSDVFKNVESDEFMLDDYNSILNEATSIDDDFPSISRNAYTFPDIVDLSHILSSGSNIYYDEANTKELQKYHDILRPKLLQRIKNKLIEQYELPKQNKEETQGESIAVLNKKRAYFNSIVLCSPAVDSLNSDTKLDNYLFWGMSYWGPKNKGERPTIDQCFQFFSHELESLFRRQIDKQHFIKEHVKSIPTGNHNLLMGAAISAEELPDYFDDKNQLIEEIIDDLNFIDRHADDWEEDFEQYLPTEDQVDKEKYTIDTDDKSTSPLPEPFSNIFTDRDEAQQAFDLLRDTLDGLGVSQTGDERVVLNFRYDRGAIHFTFARWYVIGFYGPELHRERVHTVMLKKLVEEKGYRLSNEDDEFTFATHDSDPEVTVCSFDFHEVQTSDFQEDFRTTLDTVRNHFDSWDRSNFREHHIPALEEMVFDDEARSQYLSEGIRETDMEPDDTDHTEPPTNEKNYFWVTANPDLWSVEEIMDGGEIFYTYKTDEGTHKRIKSAFEKAEEGDHVIFYESSPRKEVVGTGEITEGLHREIPLKKEEPEEGVSMNFNNKKYGIDWETLTDVPELQDSSPIRNQARGSLFSLTRDEYETILSLEQSPPGQISPKKSWDDLTDVDTERRFRMQPDGGAKTLHFPHTLEERLEQQISSAIKAGKHIILVGPPGTGKSKLAKRICVFYLDDPDRYNMTTATSDWSTFDTIGGLMPDQNSGGDDLTFDSGLFLNCFREGNQPANNWLIIDEINRADIDKAFGSLFSVLTGDAITLSHKADNGDPVHIRPEQDDENVADIEQHEFVLPDDWRMIATMNTYDKSSLYEMSYAFMRRFAFIPVGIPDDITEDDIRAYASTWEDVQTYEDMIENAHKLWTSIQSHRQIGPAIVRDLMQHVDGGGDWTSAVFLYVFPQFEGLRKDDQVNLIKDLTDLDFIDGDQMEKQAQDFFRLDPAQFEDNEE
jgi:MoxR-like ATPase/predicted RNA-binding protein with PUA-like domain